MKSLHYFHIGRGGIFNNANHKTYVGLINIDEIESKIDLILNERDEKGRYDNTYYDNVGNPVITRRDFLSGIKKGRLVVEFDTIYDTDIFVSENEMLNDEKELIKCNS